MPRTSARASPKRWSMLGMVFDYFRRFYWAMRDPPRLAMQSGEVRAIFFKHCREISVDHMFRTADLAHAARCPAKAHDRR